MRSEPTTYRWFLVFLILISLLPGSIAGIIYRNSGDYHGLDIDLLFMAVPVIFFSLMLLVLGLMTRSDKDKRLSKLFLTAGLLFPICFYASYKVAKQLGSGLFPAQVAFNMNGVKKAADAAKRETSHSGRFSERTTCVSRSGCHPFSKEGSFDAALPSF